jgi:outer membrane protein TolC
MSMLRHSFAKCSKSLIAVGTGALITLNYAQLGAAQELPVSSPQALDGIASNQSLEPKLLAEGVNPSNSSSSLPATSAPANLNPSANPLLFPTKPEEVKIDLSQAISLQQAQALARRNNRQLQTTLLTLERTKASLREALAAEFPSVSLQSSLTRADSRSASSSTSLNPNDPSITSNSDTARTSFDNSLQLSYNLYTGGQRPARIRAAEEQVRFQELEVERQSEEVRLNVTNAYYDLQEAGAQIDIARDAVRQAEQSLRDAQLRVDAGVGTEFEVLQAQVQLADAQQSLTRARSQQSTARRKLVQLLSLSQTVDVRAADPIEQAGDWNLSLEQSIILALKNRAELQQQLAQRNISEQQGRVALAGIKPQVNLFANYDVLDVFSDGRPAADGFTLGARLQWNLYDGGASRARAEQERVNQAIAETQFADNRDQIRFQVEQAFFNLNANRQNITTASVAVQQATRSLELARLRFRAGVGISTDVITAQTELTRARVNQLTAVLDYNRSLASLQRAVSNFPSGTPFSPP